MVRINEIIQRARLRLLQMHRESGVGHIGGNLSCLDILITLHHAVMGDADLFVLSKGHAAGALYVTLWSQGLLSDEDLTTFHKDNTTLSGHPPPNRIPQIPFATGSLGHGLSLACGLALSKKIKGEPGRVYCLLSDGELEEGSTWEAVIFVAHQHLPVTIVIDANGLQGFGSIQEVASLEPLSAKFRAFGLETMEISGHAPAALQDACISAPEGPVVLVARTNKGHGVSYMTGKMEWHYLPMSADQYERAKLELVTR